MKLIGILTALLVGNIAFASCEGLDFIGGKILAKNSSSYQAVCLEKDDEGCSKAQIYQTSDAKGNELCKAVSERVFAPNKINKSKKLRKRFTRKMIYWTDGPWNMFLIGHPYRLVRENYKTNRSSVPASAVFDTILLPVTIPVGIVTGILAWRTKSKYKKLLQVITDKRDEIKLKYYVEFSGVARELEVHFPAK